MSVTTELYELRGKQLRGMLFWATVGITSCEGGAFPECEGRNGTVASLARAIGFQLPQAPVFKARKEARSLAHIGVDEDDRPVSTELPAS
jgi:hypothetical protein